MRYEYVVFIAFVAPGPKIDVGSQRKDFEDWLNGNAALGFEPVSVPNIYGVMRREKVE